MILVKKTDSILRFMFGIQERVCAMIFLIKSSVFFVPVTLCRKLSLPSIFLFLLAGMFLRVGKDEQRNAVKYQSAVPENGKRENHTKRMGKIIWLRLFLCFLQQIFL